MHLLPDPVHWLEGNWKHDKVSGKAGEPWLLADAPFLGAIVRDYADPAIRDLILMCAAQGAKSTTSMACVGYAAANMPDTTLWAMPSINDAESIGDRLIDALLRCKATASLMPKARYGVNGTEIDFPCGKLELVGSGGKGNQVSSRPVGRLHLDEEKDWDAKAVAKAIKRVRSRWNAKVFRVSTPKCHNDSIHLAFKEGDQRRWFLKCPHCSEEHAFGWRLDEERPLIKWEEGETDDDTAASIRYEFPCGHVTLRDNKTDREWIYQHGFWKATNPKAAKNKRSYTWSALLPKWVKWRDIVSEFKLAHVALKAGDVGPLLVWVTETLGEPWENKAEADPITLDLADYHLADYRRGSETEPLKLIDGESKRFMTIDRQAGQRSKGDIPHRWVVVRAWAAGGRSRLLYEGRVETSEGCREIQKLFGVKDQLVAQDMGYDIDAVLEDCGKYGWIGIRGDDADGHSGWVHGENKKDRRPYSAIQYALAANNKRVPYVLIAKQRVADITARLKAGTAAAWDVGKDVSKTYLKQLGGQVKVEEVDKKKGKTRLYWKTVGDDHLLDCEHYQTGFALMMRLIADIDTAK